MIATVVGSVLATLSVCFGIAGGVALYFQRRRRPLEAPSSGRTEILEGRIGAIEGKVAAQGLTLDGLSGLWKDERERMKNHADRAVAAYKSTEEVLDLITGRDDDEGEGGDVPEFDEEALGLMSPLLGDVGGSAKRADEEATVRERARRHLSAMG